MVCAVILPRPCVADLPPLPAPDAPAPSQSGWPTYQGIHLPNVDQDPEDHLEILARIDLLLRDIDRLLVALRAGRTSRDIRAASPRDERIAIFHDLSGVLRHYRVWPVDPADAAADNTVPTAAGFGSGLDSIVLSCSAVTGDGRLPADGWQSERAVLLQDFNIQASMRGVVGNRIRGRTDVSRYKLKSQRLAGGAALGDQYFLDWPWVTRMGRNMFYWVVGPPASIICLSIALGAVLSSKRS